MIRIHKPFLFTLATFALMTLSACASTNSVDTTDSVAVLPDAEPGIRGVITKSDSNVGSRFILVEENPGDAAGSQKAAVRLTDQTKIYRRSGSSFEAIGHAEVALGKRVRVWFEGPVAESYPIQGAAAVVLLEE